MITEVYGESPIDFKNVCKILRIPGNTRQETDEGTRVQYGER